MKRSIGFALRGALGCVVGALLGELLLMATRPPAAAAAEPSLRPPQALALLLDCSGSMRGSKMEEMRAAAARFAARQDLERDAIAVVRFADWAELATRLTHEEPAVDAALRGMRATDGGTSMDIGLAAAVQSLEGATVRRNVLLFTDGRADDPRRALKVAGAARALGVRLVAVATGDADVDYLARLTGDPALVFEARAGNYGEGFRSAERAIYGPPVVVESGASASSATFLETLARIGGWTALLAVGIALALVTAQNRRLKKPVLSPRQALAAVPGGLSAGFLAGAAGQAIFLGVTRFPALDQAGRIAAWALLGALVGVGMALFVANLKPRRALLGGAVGGAVGAVGFLWAAGSLGDLAGRLAGAASLGFFIGLMIALVEVMFREAWLEIGYGPREKDTVTLGANPVTIGSDAACTVWSADAPPVAFRYQLRDGKIVCENVASDRRDHVAPGHSEQAGKLTLTVRGSDLA